jgi:hypothetical protein
MKGKNKKTNERNSILQPIELYILCKKPLYLLITLLGEMQSRRNHIPLAGNCKTGSCRLGAHEL